MKIQLAKIVVDAEKRVRKDNGDITALKESIDKVGLLQPLIVDENNVLLAGFRRFLACQELKMIDVEVQVVQCKGDKHKILDIELAENVGRKDFSEDEIQSTQQMRDDINKELRGTWWARVKKWFRACFPRDAA